MVERSGLKPYCSGAGRIYLFIVGINIISPLDREAIWDGMKFLVRCPNQDSV